MANSSAAKPRKRENTALTDFHKRVMASMKSGQSMEQARKKVKSQILLKDKKAK